LFVTAQLAHDEVFSHFRCFDGEVDEGFRVDFLGVRARAEWFMRRDRPYLRRVESTSYPEVNEAYLEWVGILSAVRAARDRFTMIELGAGWGRWVVRAAVALRQLRKVPCRLVAVEAEPTHFQWLCQHFRDNGLDPTEHVLLEAAVGPQDGHVYFATGKPDGWYGQHIVAKPGYRGNPPRDGLLRRLWHSLGGRNNSGVVSRRVKCVSLASILAPLDCVDLIDADIQGSEADVFEAAADKLKGKVRRVHIGTHSREVEERLRRLFTGLGWQCTFDFPCHSDTPTPWGVVHFDDGVQSWGNPCL